MKRALRFLNLRRLSNARRFLLLALLLRIGSFVPIVAGCIYLLIFMPGAPSIAIIQGTTESVSYEVSTPEMAQIRLNGFALYFEPPGIADLSSLRKARASANTSHGPLCLSGLIIPTTGTKVTYKRFGPGPISVIFERTDERAAATFDITGGNVPAVLKQTSWIRLEASSEAEKSSRDGTACKGLARLRLPIYGVAEIGSELRPAGKGDEPTSGILIDGTLDVLAQTREIRFLSDRAPRIYPAQSGLTLPPGSRIIEYRLNGAFRQPWTGFVEPKSDQALAVSVTTPATRLAILRPGSGLQPDVLAISLFTQLANDPVLISAQVVLAFFFSAFQILSSILSWRSREERPSIDGIGQ